MPDTEVGRGRFWSLATTFCRVIKQQPKNETECKTEVENRCTTVQTPVQDQECKQVAQPECRPVSKKITKIIQVKSPLSATSS